jgi:hypothetical protein
MEYPFYLLDIDENDEIHGVDAIGLVDQPAIEMGWQAFNSGIKPMKFEVQDESEQILAGALMVANLPIPRVDDKGNVFYVMFTPKTIKKIVEKIKTENTKITFNINHDDGRKIEAVLVGDFMVSEKMGMQAPAWHQKLSDGSWFGFVKIKDKDDYEYAKDNLTGFSIEGIFDQIKYRDVDEELITEIKNNITHMKKIEKELGADIASKLKKLIFGEHTEEKEKEKEMGEEEETETELAEAVLADGTIVAWEGELEVGTAVFVVTEEGQVAAPDARHELADGSYVTTAGGVVTEIESAAAEPVIEEMASSFELSEAQMGAILTQVMEAIKPSLNALSEKIGDQFNRNQEINKAMFKMIEQLAKSEHDKEDKFNKQGQTLSLAQRKLAALASIK